MNFTFWSYTICMLIYDTLSNKKKRVIKPKRGKLKLFVCGPTVYNYSHIGHARTYLAFDMTSRWLRHRGFNLFYLQNITDLDDKIPDFKTARRFEKEYMKDMKLLGIDSIDKYARAGSHLPEIKKQIKALLDKGYAYKTSSGVYFEVSKFSEYGKLSQQNLEQLRPGWRIEPDPQKKDPLDFSLWKIDKKWNLPSPWGRGRPGWHIEDTAITEKYFGSQYDLHGGAVDLKFPHHESEIAQQEAVSGKKPMVKTWIHAGFLLINGEKMSKSLGNFITIRKFLKYPLSSPLVKRGNERANLLRLLVLSHHYRSPINYTEKLVKQTEKTLQGIDKFMRTISNHSKNTSSLKASRQARRTTEKLFIKAMDDDFNTPKALAVLFDFMAVAEKNDKNKHFLAEKLNILGFKMTIPKIPVGVNKLLIKRGQHRDNKNFKSADRIRDEIKRKRFFVED